MTDNQTGILNVQISRAALGGVLRAHVLGARYDPATDMFEIAIEAKRFPGLDDCLRAEPTTLVLREVPNGLLIEGLQYDLLQRMKR